MRRTWLLVALLILAACGLTEAEPTATVTFQIDALTCQGAGVIDFVIDGAVVGTETLAAGGKSKPYTTTQSVHFLGAKLSATGYTWPATTVDLTGIATYIHILPC